MEPEPSSIFSNIWFITIGGGVVVLLIGGAFWRWWDNNKKNSGGEVPGPQLSLAKNWRTTFRENEKDYHENVEIHQNGHRVSGTIKLMDINNPDQITDFYEFEGVFKNRILTGIFEPKDTEDYERGAFALERQGKILKGKYIFFTKTEGEPITSSSYKWESIK